MMNCNSSNDIGEENTKILIGITASVAGISFFCCLGVILLIVLFKKYLFFTQRMILYLDIAAMLSSLARIINVNIGLSKSYCEATGFLDQYMSSCFLIAITLLTIDIFLQAIFSLNTKKVELLYVLLIFFLPATYCWIPFRFNAYGPAGPWCWIMDRYFLQYALFYIPYFIVFPLLLVLVMSMLCVLYLRRHDYEATIDPLTSRKRTALRKEIKILLLYPILIMLLNIVPLAVRVYDSVTCNSMFELWVANSFIAPLEGAVIAVIFTIDPETRRRLTFSHIRGAFHQLCSRSLHGRVSEYPAEIKQSTESYGGEIASRSNSSDRQPLLKEHYSYDSTM